MNKEGTDTNETGLVRILVILILLIIAGIFLWHWYLSMKIKDRSKELSANNQYSDMEFSVSVNPFTNLISMTVTLPPELVDDNNIFAAFGAALSEAMLKNLGPGFLERELNTIAREEYDLFAMFIPYRVRVITEKPSAEVIGAWRQQQEQKRIERELEQQRLERLREQQRLEEQKAARTEKARKRRKCTEYISKYITLENVHVSLGTNFGRTVKGIFGTLVNNGDRALNTVRIRIFFLDSEGKRIGEKAYSPILVTEYSFNDETPLKPNYRKDFGYNLENDAPSGWVEKVEVEIENIEFAEFKP